jgi:hypothetical protein
VNRSPSPNGGKREGAGRKAGVPNKRAQHAIEVAELTGIMPLDFSLAGMRFHQALIEAERAKGEKADEDIIRAEYAAGEVYARDAAPYLHNKLTAVTHTGKNGGPIETADVGIARNLVRSRIAGIAGRIIASGNPE